MGRLSATSVKATKEPGCYGDGDGLYLVVTPSGSKSWVCRVQKNGKRRDIGLGSVKKVPLPVEPKRLCLRLNWCRPGERPQTQPD
ncbi:Arm DNA-binding domain-containing protein [Acetobacter persici]|uniref:Arm DNA-binding domain-containing protein n=1 Tax=Acetobacter persici TaxID=1076596 RepID=UPI0020133DEC|nr:Arm DNA-binding domain-containing protein [Acetobacter persici]